MDVKSILIGESLMLVRAAVVGLAFYATWSFLSGAGFLWKRYAMVIIALFLATNAIFLTLRRFKPWVVDLARSVENDI